MAGREGVVGTEACRGVNVFSVGGLPSPQCLWRRCCELTVHTCTPVQLGAVGVTFVPTAWLIVLANGFKPMSLPLLLPLSSCPLPLPLPPHTGAHGEVSLMDVGRRSVPGAHLLH